MAVDTYALITLEYLKAYMGLADTDIAEPGLTIFHDAGTSSTAATVEVTNATIVLIVTGGGNAGTSTLTLADAANDTLAELAAVIDALGKGWTARAVGPDDQASGDLIEKSATNAWGSTATLTLNYVNNYRFEKIIDAASDRVERYCERKFVSRDYVEYLNGNGAIALTLSHRPVTAVARVASGRLNAIEIKCTATDATNASVRVTPTADITGDKLTESAATVILTITGGASAATTTLTLSDAANDTLTELTAVIEATSGWTATLRHTTDDAGSRLSSDLIPVPALYCKTPTSAWLEIPAIAERDYWADAEQGTISRGGGWSPGCRNVRVDYTAGYSTVPDDLQLATAELCKMIYDASEKDSQVKGEKIGQYAYTLLAEETPITGRMRDRLEPFRRMIYV